MGSVEQRLLVDGWAFVSENFEVMGDNVLLMRSKGVRISHASERLYKGVRRLHGKEGVAIMMGGVLHQVDKLADYVLIVTGGPEGEQLNLEAIRSAYLESVDAAIASLDADKTKFDWYSTNPCHKFSEQATLIQERNGCILCNGVLTVQPTDLGTFGAAMNASMKQMFEERELDYQVCMIVSRFGQSQSLKSTENIWGVFRPQLCEEIVVHLAKDIVQAGKCLLWSTRRVENKGYEGEKHIFNNLFLGKHASFEFDRMRTFGPAVQIPSSGVMFYANLKFYIDPFKEIHRGPDEPWKRPEVERTFTTIPPYGIPKTPPIKLLKWLGVLKNCRRLMAEKGCNVARFEAVLNMSGENLGFENGEPTPKLILSEFKSFFEMNFEGRDGILSNLKSFEFADFLHHVDETLMRAVNTLEGLVKKVMALREDSSKELSFQLPSLGDVVLGVACEVLISFGVYGAINYFAGRGARHDKAWIRDLGIQKQQFTLQRRVFGGLTTLRGVQPHDGTAENPFRCISYNGPFYLLDHVAKTLHKSGMGQHNGERLAKLIKDVYLDTQKHGHQHNPRPSEASMALYRQISEAIWDEMAENMYHVSKDDRGLERSPSSFIQIAKNCIKEMEHLTFQNSFEFIEKLFKNDDKKINSGIAYCVNELRRILSPRNMTAFLIEVMAIHFDVEIYKSRGLAFVYCWGLDAAGRYDISYVLPCVGSQEDSYMISSIDSRYQDVAEKKLHVQEHWKFAFVTLFKRLPFNLDVLDMYLVAASEVPNVLDRHVRTKEFLETIFVVDRSRNYLLH